MNCQEFDFIVNDLARAKPLEATLRESGIAHAATCERCCANLKDERALTAGLKALAAGSENTSAPQQIEAALIAAFRQQSKAAVTSNVIALPVRHRRNRVWVFAAAAAVIIAATTIVASQLLKEPSSKQPIISRAPNASVSPAVNPEKQGQDVAAEIADPDRKAPVKPRKKRLPRQPTNDRSQVMASVGEFTPVFGNPESGQEVTTDFFPMVHEQASQPLESGQLIRVQMPRSTLASFGLPVNFDRANVPVKADVLLAEDGSARAIRFVR